MWCENGLFPQSFPPLSSLKFLRVSRMWNYVFAQPKHFFGDILKDLQLSKFWHFPWVEFCENVFFCFLLIKETFQSASPDPKKREVKKKLKMFTVISIDMYEAKVLSRKRTMKVQNWHKNYGQIMTINISTIKVQRTNTMLHRYLILNSRKLEIQLT